MTHKESTQTTHIEHALQADLNFIAPSTELKPRVIYSGDEAPQRYNKAYQFISTPIQDGRYSNEEFKLDQHGFQLLATDIQHKRFDDDDIIRKHYYPEVETIVKKVSGAQTVFVFDHTVRRGQANSHRKPAHHVHNDYTEATGMLRAKEMIGEDALAAMKDRRMIQINVWKPIKGPVKRSPLAFCDAQSIQPENLIATEIHFTDTDHIGEIFALRKNQQQRWFYFSDMTEDEIVLIKGYDTLKDGVARFTPHTAFEYKDQDPQAPARESIETRTFAFY